MKVDGSTVCSTGCKIEMFLNRKEGNERKGKRLAKYGRFH
jgi:hypothetical protein